MAKKGNAAQAKTVLLTGDPPPPAKRNANGTWMKGYSGAAAIDAARARRQLNLSTIGALQEAFNKYGNQAIEKVAKTQPAIFLKMLVLLVPRELEVTHSGGVKSMSDEQLEAAIEAVKAVLARRSGEAAKVVDVTPALPPADPPAETP